MTPHNEAAARRAQSSCGSSGISKSALLYKYRTEQELSTEDTFIQFGDAAAAVLAGVAKRYHLSRHLARAICELARLKGAD